MDLVLTTSQKLALSQRMLQSAEILQMSSAELVEYIKELSVENPVVEYEENRDETSKFDLLKKKLDWLDAADEQNKTYYKEDKEDESDNDNWKFKENDGEDLEAYLKSQLNVLHLKKREYCIGNYLIESMDQNGYLEDTPTDIAGRLRVPTEEVLSVLRLIQDFEPVGVGASCLKECLLLQLGKLDKKYPLAERIVELELETLAKNQIHMIVKHLKAPLAEVLCACELVRSLNPKPGNSFTSDRNLEYITPDVIIVKEKDEYQIVLNDYFYPKISINSYYKNIIGNDSPDQAKEYVYDKIKQAEWAIKCISKRNSTLVKTMEVILHIQKDFFDLGAGHMHPMRLSDVAEQIGMHESTVSRAVRDKYLQCSWGVFALSHFFANGIAARSAEQADRQMTPECVKIQIKEIIDREDKHQPLSDRAITEALIQKGISISRRTVAKYRESMGILGTSGRKEYE